MCHSIPKVCLSPIAQVPPESVCTSVGDAIVWIPRHSQTQKNSQDPPVSILPFSLMSFEKHLLNCLILSDYTLIIFLILSQRYVNIHKRHDPYPTSGDISGISSQQVGDMFQPRCPAVTQHSRSDSAGGRPLLVRLPFQMA